ncbi:MAG: SAM-dependent methyltransferase [Tabrizicola sp.]
MSRQVSDRIAQAVARLPLAPGMRVLEIGCGPGVAARLVAARIGPGSILAIDRSSVAIAQATRGSAAELVSGRLELRCIAIEDLELSPGEPPFDLAFALRVGALDGRHPEAGRQALRRLKRALRPEGLLFIDACAPVAGRDLPE